MAVFPWAQGGSAPHGRGRGTASPWVVEKGAEGSEGSEGSKGSEGYGLPLRGNKFYNAAKGGRRYGSGFCVIIASPSFQAVVDIGMNHSSMESAKGSREISRQKAAFRQSHQHGVSCRLAASYTLSRCAGLPLKGKQDVTCFPSRLTRHSGSVSRQ